MTQPQTDLPSWSLQSAGAPAPSHAALRRGRPEEMQEQGRFAAALSRAAPPQQARTHEAAGNEAAGNIAYTRLPSRPEERQSGEAPVGIRHDQFFGEDGFGISDLIDIVNPLQHIPGVSTVYRAMTGDEISPGARLAGGTLYGGPLGFASALADNVSEDLTGRDVAGSMVAAFTGEPDAVDPDMDGGALAEADTSPDTASFDPAMIAPAAGAQGPAAQMAAQSAVQSEPPPRSQASPLMAAQPVGSPFAAQPSGNSPMAVLRPPGAPTVLNRVHGQQLDVGPTPVSAPVNPAAAAAQGVPTLSPEAANMLMRLSQQSAPAPQAAMTAPQAPMTASPPNVAAPPETAAAPPPAPSPAPSPEPAREPSTASATAEQGGGRTQSAAFFDPVPAEDLPAAMMEALQKYESMKQ